jgi:hypothetical protein
MIWWKLMILVKTDDTVETDDMVETDDSVETDDTDDMVEERQNWKETRILNVKGFWVI